MTGIDGLPVHAGTGGLIAAADRPTYAAVLEKITDQAAPRR